MARRRLLEDYLLGRLSLEPTKVDAALSKLSRRAFLGSLGASSIAAAHPMVGRGRPFSVQRTPGGFSIAYGGQTWSLDREMFGRNAALNVARTREGWTIRLARATMPGTSVPVNFEIALIQRLTWRIKFAMPSMRTTSEMNLVDWLRGMPALSGNFSARYRSGRGTIKVTRSRVAISSDGGLALRFHGGICLDGRIRCEGRSLMLRISRRSEFLHASDNRAGWSTHFEVDEPMMPAKSLACGNGNERTLLRIEKADSVSGEFFETATGSEEALLLGGLARMEMRQNGLSDGPLRFNRAAVAIRPDRIGIAGDICTDPAFFRSRNLAVRYRGDQETPFSAVFENSGPAHFEALVRVSEFRLPVAGGELQVTLPDRPMVLSTQPLSRTVDEFIVVDPQPMIVTKLEQGVIRVRSPENLLDLKFTFEGFELHWGRLGAPVLTRTKKGAYYVDGLMVVEFPPQHLSETIQDPGGSPGCVDAEPLEKTWLSEPSRVAFAFARNPSSLAIWKSQDLTIENLTDWTGLTMAVDPRAAASITDTDVVSQLAVPKITAGQNAVTVLDAIGRTIIPPGPSETSLELVDKLVFSPAENAIWERSELTTTSSTPIFGARIGNASNAATARTTRLRALYSRSIPNLAGKIPNETALSHSIVAEAPLTARDHWEIIGQTSVYGLPALRRISDADTKDALDKSPGDPDLIVTKVARSGVVRPDGYAYLDEFDRALSNGAPETGVALATVFETADVTLTSLGATMLLDWRGQPPLLRSLDGSGPRSFSLERLLYQAWLGRDVRVVAVNKGYLFPFGVPATFVTVSERAFLRGPFGKPVAKEIRRRFVTASSAPKRFPAVNQPDAGRDFPAHSVTMLTTRTPDLIDAVDEASGLVPGFQPGQAFWPRMHNGAGTVVDFDWKSIIDEEPTPVVNRMLFVDQTMTGHDDVKRIVDYYNGDIATGDPGTRDKWPAQNVARLGSARRSYAARREETQKIPGSSMNDMPPVDTAYDTDSWLLVARGRSGAGDSAENYVMDARMNGADQPPFYPSVRRAAISVQSIDRLVGRPQGVIVARPYQPYVESAFDPTKNKSEIFLEIVSPIIALDVAGAGQPATGGVAQPKTMVAALSRISGVVGGTNTSARKMLAPRNDTASQLDFSSAAAGEFDPREFFSPTIFGIDILSGLANLPKDFTRAPRLSELTEQGVGADRVDAIRTAADAARKAIAERGAKIDAALRKFEANLPKGVTFKQLYPALEAAYRDLMRGVDLQLATVAAPNSSLGDATTAAIRITALAKPFFSEVGRLVRDPVPPLVNDLINEIIGYWTTFADLMRHLPETIAAELRRLVQDKLAELTAVGADQLALLFGLDSGETVIDLATKSEARARLGETLLYEQIGAPMIDLLDSAERLFVELSGTVMLGWSVLHDSAEIAIDQANQALAGILVDDDVLDPVANILREKQVEALATALADATVAKVRALTMAPDLSTAIATLQRMSGELVAGRPTYVAIYAVLDAEIRARQAWFKAIDPADAVNRFTTAVVSALMATVTRAISDQIAETLPLIQALEQKALDAIVEIALNALQAVLKGGDALERLAKVASDRTASWCSSAVGGVLGAVKAIGHQVLADQSLIEASIARIGTEVAQVQLPTTVPASIAQQFDVIRADLGKAVAGAISAAHRLGTARVTLDQMTAADTCAATTAFASALRDCIAERGHTLRSLRAVILQVRALDRLSRTAPADFNQAVAVHLAQIVSLAKNLVTGASVSGKVDLPGVWNDTIAKAKNRLLQDIAVDQFRKDLTASYDTLVADGKALRNAVATATPEMLIDLTERAIMLSGADRRFAGLIIETVALTDSARAKIESVAIELVKGAAHSLRVLHELALKPLLALQQLAVKQPVVAYLLAGFAGFDQIVADVTADVARLAAIENAPDFDSLVNATDALRAVWTGGDIPLVRAVRGLGAFVDAILKGKFSDLVGDYIRGLMTEMENELRELISQFVPTKIQTRYDWNTKIDDVNAGLLAFTMVVKSDTNLTITSSIDFDFLSGERKTSVLGKLEAFNIAIDASANFFTLSFDGATFSSINGASPTFDARFKTVTLGPALKFLEQLQQLLGSSGNGVYVQPQFDKIRVGYGFSRDQINVGPLVVSNVALDVYAELPFTDESPEFGFIFASPAKPFLISYPPYGGGGWVSVKCHPGLVKTGGHYDIGLSLMFGAVAPINFGPLKGNGRICAGIEFLSETISTFVEAVGEGNIACFSISIYIGIILAQDNSGNLDGEAILEFKFKVAFCTFKYKVVAHRHIYGPGGSTTAQRPAGMLDSGLHQAALLADDALRAVGLMVGQHTHTSTMPSKSKNWTKYRRYASLELLLD
jgi:hypothetical protein